MKNNLIRVNLKILSFMTLYVLTIFGVLGAAPASAATWQDSNWTQNNPQTSGSWISDNHRTEKVSSFNRRFKAKKKHRIKRHALKKKFLRSHRAKRTYRHYGHKNNHRHCITCRVGGTWKKPGIRFFHKH